MQPQQQTAKKKSSVTSAPPMQSVQPAPPPVHVPTKMEELDTQENEMLLETEQLLEATYGVYWRICRDEISGWDSMRPYERREAIDKATKAAAKMRDQYDEHDYILNKLAPPAVKKMPKARNAQENAYVAYNDNFVATDNRKGFELAVKAARKAMERVKGDSYKTAIRQKDEEEEVEEYRASVSRKYGIELKGTTIEALRGEKRTVLEGQREEREKTLLASEKALLEKQHPVYFAKVYESLKPSGTGNISYREERVRLAMARDMLNVLAAHTRRMGNAEYKAAYTDLLPQTKPEAPDDFTFVLDKTEEIKKLAAQKMEAADKKTDADLRRRMDAAIDKKKMKAADKEEAQHKILDEEEAKYEQRYAQESYDKSGIGTVAIPYTKVGRKQGSKALTVKDRQKLIEQQLHLLRKHAERSVVSEEYESTFQRLKEESDKKAEKDRSSMESMVAQSTKAGRSAASGKIKGEEQKRLHYHQSLAVDALYDKYKAKYGDDFEAEYTKLLAKKPGATPREREEIIKQAKKEYGDKYHVRMMRTSATYAGAYGFSMRPTEAGQRKAARRAVEKREQKKARAADTQYTEMFEAVSGTMVRSKTAKRRAQKHSDRMQNNAAYKEAFEASMVSAPSSMSKRDKLQAARKAARHKAKLANKTARDEAAEQQYGEALYQEVLAAYGEKYKDSTKEARSHATKRAKVLARERDHHTAMKTDNAESLAYKTTYEDAIRSGKTPSDAQKLARKRREKVRKVEAKRTLYAGKAEAKADSLPELGDQMEFYSGKYADPKKAYKHAKASAKELRDKREAEGANDFEIVNHPQYRNAFMEAFEKSQDEQVAAAYARKKVIQLMQADQKAQRSGRFAAKSTEQMDLSEVGQLNKWRDSRMVRAAARVQEIEKTNPEETKSLLAKIQEKMLTRVKSNEGKVDAPKPKGEEGESYGSGDTKDAVMEVGTGGKEAYDGAKEALDEGKALFTGKAPEEEEDSFLDKMKDKALGAAYEGMGSPEILKQVKGLYDKFSFLLDPIKNTLSLAKDIISFVKDKWKGDATAQANIEFTIKVLDYIPTITKTTADVGALVAEKAFQNAAPFIGGIQACLESFMELTGNVIKMAHAMHGAKELKAQRKKSKEAMLKVDNRSAMVLVQSRPGASTKTKVLRSGVRNLLQQAEEKKGKGETVDEGNVEALKRWHRDKEYQRMFEKVIRDRALDIGQNVLGVVQGLSQFVPEVGTFVSLVLSAVDSSVSFLRTAVKHGKQMGREVAARHSTVRGAGMFDLDRTKAAKFKERSMFAEMVYNEMVALPLPKAFDDVEPDQRKTWLAGTLAEYKRIEVYTSMAMDLREILNAETKEKILEALVSGMAASSH